MKPLSEIKSSVKISLRETSVKKKKNGEDFKMLLLI